MSGRMLLCVAAALLSAGGAPGETPAERKIAAAHRALAHGPPTADSYNELALALARRARESADPEYYRKAHDAVAESLRLAPDNFEAKKARIWTLLGQHEFAQARVEAIALNQRMPDDLMVYAMLVDAHAELGEYREAEAAAQWLLDLRPGNVSGLTRAAYLRELFGDLEGAIEMMSQAYQRTPPHESEDRAWLLTQLAHLQRLSGRLSHADALIVEAFKLFPNYHYALAELAKVRMAQKRPAEAVGLLRQRYAIAPHPENLYELAVALKADGQRREAKSAFEEFERKARAESGGADNANRELILYYTDHARRPKDALRLAEQEIGRRADVTTRAAYAWALFANGKKAEARQQFVQVLAVGVRDPVLLEQARRTGVALPEAK